MRWQGQHKKVLKLYFHCGLSKKTVVGYIDLEQKETYEKLKNRGWYSKWYWYFSNAATSNNNKNDDNTPASTNENNENTNENNNYNNYNNNNVLIIKVIITIKMKVVVY